jgi:hypothetical protein
MRNRAEYEERSGWPWWVHSLLLLVFLAVVWPLIGLGGEDGGERASAPGRARPAFLLLVGMGFPLLFYTFMGSLRTRVFSDAVEMSWGLAGVIRKRIPLEEIREARSVTYSPLREFGGWGIRAGGHGKTAWNIRGDQAVLLVLGDGTRFYLGSDRPEEAARWIRAALAKGKGEA